MDEFLFERFALLNALRRAAMCYSAASLDFAGSLARLLTEHARARQDFCRTLSHEWGIVLSEWDAEDVDVDDARRRAQSGLAAVAELVATLEFALAGILNDMTDSAIDAKSREALLADSADLRAKLRDEQLMLRANLEVADDGGRELTLDRRGPKDASVSALAHQFEVFFATNRTPIFGAGALIGFGSRRSDDIHYGHCEVTIPKTHRIGSIGSHWWHRIGRGDDRLRLATIAALEPDRYFGLRFAIAFTIRPHRATQLSLSMVIMLASSKRRYARRRSAPIWRSAA
jgi:hypothetical protein